MRCYSFQIVPYNNINAILDYYSYNAQNLNVPVKFVK